MGACLWCRRARVAGAHNQEIIHPPLIRAIISEPSPEQVYVLFATRELSWLSVLSVVFTLALSAWTTTSTLTDDIGFVLCNLRPTGSILRRAACLPACAGHVLACGQGGRL